MCNGTVTTNHFSSRRLNIIKRGRPHTHASEDAEIFVDDVVCHMKHRATSHPNEPPAQVIWTEMANEHREEILVKLPERRLLLRTINRHQNTARPPLPTTLADIEINHPYNITLTTHQQFLKYDSGSDAPRIIMFYTVRDLRYLCSSSSVFMDGTFKCAPRL